MGTLAAKIIRQLMDGDWGIGLIGKLGRGGNVTDAVGRANAYVELELAFYGSAISSQSAVAIGLEKRGDRAFGGDGGAHRFIVDG